jgi:hypothetical protein
MKIFITAFLVLFTSSTFVFAAEPIKLSSESVVSSWGLPVSLGQSAEQVRKVLGAPHDALDIVHDKSSCGENPRCVETYDTSDGDRMEWYYSSGIVANYQHGKLFRVTLYPHLDDRGFLPYSERIIEGVSLSDSRENIIRKLGNPAKIEKIEGLEDNYMRRKKTSSGAPARNPDQEVYYWRRQHYTIEALFLAQPELWNHGVVWPKGELIYIKVYQ